MSDNNELRITWAIRKRPPGLTLGSVAGGLLAVLTAGIYFFLVAIAVISLDAGSSQGPLVALPGLPALWIPRVPVASGSDWVLILFCAGFPSLIVGLVLRCAIRKMHRCPVPVVPPIVTRTFLWFGLGINLLAAGHAVLGIGGSRSLVEAGARAGVALLVTIAALQFRQLTMLPEIDRRADSLDGSAI